MGSAHTAGGLRRRAVNDERNNKKRFVWARGNMGQRL
jgi:hypothetical protein